VSRLDIHIARIREVIESWLRPGNEELNNAVDKTVGQGLFSRQDVEFQLNVFRTNLANNELETWVRQSGLSDSNNAKGRHIFCLHAGNLPMVGFQDVVAVLLSGAEYFGKISRKDPYLISSFLRHTRAQGVDQVRKWSLNIEYFKNLEADTILFAGSRTSVPDVKEKISELNALSAEGRYVIRTAKFSIAFLDQWNSTVCKNLTEAMLRYGGKGCRSVAVVISPFGLREVKNDLKSQMKSFLDNNPLLTSPEPVLRYQHAYNEATGRAQVWLENFLIQESEDVPELEFCAHWVQGGRGKLQELRKRFGEAVQSIYLVQPEEGFEELANAQRPALYWQPDGMDVIQNLIEG